MYKPEIIALPGDDSIKFPSGQAISLVRFGKKYIKAKTMSETNSNIFCLEVSTSPHSFNVDYKNISPIIRIHNNMGKVFVDGNVSDNNSFEELEILVYEFTLSNNVIINQYKKHYPLTRISSLISYLNSLNDNTVAVMVLSGDDTKQNVTDYNQFYKSFIKSKMYYVDKSYLVSQRWIGVWLGSTDKSKGGSLVYENYKNYSTSFIPSQLDSGKLFLSIDFNDSKSLLEETQNHKNFTTLTSFGFRLNSMNEVDTSGTRMGVMDSNGLSFNSIIEE